MKRSVLMEAADIYNQKVNKAIGSLQEKLPSFLVADGEDENAHYFLMEKGKFVGMGPLSKEMLTESLESVKTRLTMYADNDYIRGLIYQFAEKHPGRKIEILSQ
jgi:DNA polymerase III subunit epsilon